MEWNEWIDKEAKKLMELKVGWDEEGAEIPNRKVLDAVVNFFKAYPFSHLSYSIKPEFCPVQDGSIDVNFGMKLCIIFREDEITVLYIKDGKSHSKDFPCSFTDNYFSTEVSTFLLHSLNTFFC